MTLEGIWRGILVSVNILTPFRKVYKLWTRWSLIYNVRSISCVDQINAQSRPLRRVPGNSPSAGQGWPSVAGTKDGGRRPWLSCRLETSCFQLVSAACFSRSSVSYSLESFSFVNQTPCRLTRIDLHACLRNPVNRNPLS